MQTTVNQRVQMLIDYFCNGNQSQFAKEIGVSSPTVSSIISSRTNPSYEPLSKIKSRFTNVNMDWIISGEGDMIISPEKKDEIFEDLTENEREELKIIFAEFKGYLRGAFRGNSKVYNRLELMFPKSNGVAVSVA